MAMQSFTRNYEDKSTEAGFEFVFDCDNCGDGFATQFVECHSYKRGNLFRSLGEGIGAGARMLGLHNIAYGVERGGDMASRQFDGMTPEWHKEHEAAFRNAMNEAKEAFHRCHGCNTYVCDACFNEEEGMCVKCAPRENTAVSKARSRRMVEQIDEMADSADVFKGSITSKQIVCPKCGKPVAQGKFCGNCGTAVGLMICPNCGAENQQGTKFCSECGQKLGGKPKCPSCGTENEPGAKFCCDCGTKL
jgi:hypothetical protein